MATSSDLIKAVSSRTTAYTDDLRELEAMRKKLRRAERTIRDLRMEIEFYAEQAANFEIRMDTQPPDYFQSPSSPSTTYLCNEVSSGNKPLHRLKINVGDEMRGRYFAHFITEINIVNFNYRRLKFMEFTKFLTRQGSVGKKVTRTYKEECRRSYAKRIS